MHGSADSLLGLRRLHPRPSDRLVSLFTCVVLPRRGGGVNCHPSVADTNPELVMAMVSVPAVNPHRGGGGEARTGRTTSKTAPPSLLVGC